jgi:hypothetical protein
VRDFKNILILFRADILMPTGTTNLNGSGNFGLNDTMVNLDILNQTSPLSTICNFLKKFDRNTHKIVIALMVESRQTIRNWRQQSQQYFSEGRIQDYHSVLEKISVVLDLRRQLSSKEISEDDVILFVLNMLPDFFKKEFETCDDS